MNKTFLSEEEVNKALIDYYSLFIDGKLEVSKYIFMGADRLHIGFSLLIRDEDNKLIDKKRITEEDLTAAFKNYMKDSPVEYDGFKYLGGVRREGYYPGEEAPYFEGVEIQTKQKEVAQKLSLS